LIPTARRSLKQEAITVMSRLLLARAVKHACADPRGNFQDQTR